MKNGKNIIIPTGDVIFKPKKDVQFNMLLLELKLSDNVSFKSINEYNYVNIEVKNIDKIFDVANAIYESGLVEWSHPDFWVPIEKSSNDPLFGQQYYLKNTGQTGGTSGIDINVESAWCISKGTNVRVAVIDDGVESHEELTGRLLSGFTPRNSIGYGAPTTTGDHGQACAGIIGATQNNTIGISGVAPECKIIPINIFYDGFETTYNMASAINWAWDQGQADVISNSWGLDALVADGYDAIINSVNNARTLGRGGKGSVVVFSSGNALPYAGVSFPASINDVIAVGAIDKSGNIWNYSCRGVQMDLVAPSGYVDLQGDVTSTDRMNGNGFNSTNYMNNFGGTSAACPQVSGIVALMLAVNPNLTETQLRTTLQTTATDMGTSGFDNTFGYGRVNAFKALTNNITLTGATSICATNGTSTYTINGIPVGATVSWNVVVQNSAATYQLNGNSCTLYRNGITNGLVTINVSVSICNQVIPITKNINVGGPSFGTSTHAVPSDFECSETNYQCYTSGPNGTKQWFTATPLNHTSISWSKVWSIPSNGSGIIWSGNSAPNNSANAVNVYFRAANKQIVLKTTISNTCGSAEEYYCFSTNNTVCPPQGPSFTSSNCKNYNISVNPTSKQVQIKKNINECGVESADLQIKTIQIVDKVGNIIKEQNYQSDKSSVFELNLNEAKNDIYFVLIQYNDILETHQVAFFK